MDDNKGFEYVGNVPVVYKGAAYEEIYQPLLFAGVLTGFSMQ